MKYSGVEINDISSTREKIFYASIELFATKGFAATSMRDIADAVGIKPASIYNHFSSKEVILDELIDFVNITMFAYYNRVREMLISTSCLKEVLDCLFLELEVVYDITIYYGVALLSSEQFKNDKARDALYDVYMKAGVDFMTETFADCVAKGWAKTIDATACATFIMSSVFTWTLARVHEDKGNSIGYSPSDTFLKLKLFLLDALKLPE